VPTFVKLSNWCQVIKIIWCQQIFLVPKMVSTNIAGAKNGVNKYCWCQKVVSTNISGAKKWCQQIFQNLPALQVLRPQFTNLAVAANNA